MSGIVAANPAGRLDVLAYRLAERGAERIMPREWPVLAPHVAKLAEKHLGPKALGDVTWVDLWLWSNPVTASLAPGLTNTTYGQAILQSAGLLKTPTPSITPNAQVPAAPMTEAKMKSWSPDDLAEATAQRGAQYRIDSAFVRSANASSDRPDAEMTWIWVALAASAVGVILLLRR